MADVIPFTGKTLDPATSRAIADDVLVNGARPVDWWKRQGTDLHNKFMDTVRQSMEAGEGIDKMRKRISGGVIDGVQIPGIMKASKANAEALARTATSKVTNEARLRTFEDNKDVIKGMKQVSTLDNRTSVICAAYDGQTWALPDYEPIAPSTLAFNGGPPRHFNCRSTLVPIVRSWEELGIPAKELTPSTRASMDGQVPVDQTFDAFLKKKGKTFQDALLGPVRARLWRAGKVTLQQMLDFRGQPLSPEELLKLSAKRKARAAKIVPVPVPAPASKAYSNPQEDAATNEWHKTSWDDSPDYVISALKNTPPLTGGTKYVKSGAYYQPGKNYINMGEARTKEFHASQLKSLREQGTWRHEYGHHIDAMWSENLPTALRHSTQGHISAAGKLRSEFSKSQRVIKKTMGTDSAAIDRRSLLTYEKHLEYLMEDNGVEYLTKEFKKHGLDYQEVRDLFRRHMDETMDAPMDMKMRTTMGHLLAAIETKNIRYYLRAVWQQSQFHQNGINGKIADYYGAITNNWVGWGHSKSYYKYGIFMRTTEAFANAVTILGGEPQWAKITRLFPGHEFLDEVEATLKNKGPR